MKEVDIRILINFQTLLTIARTLDYDASVVEFYHKELKPTLTDIQIQIAEFLICYVDKACVTKELESMTQMIINSGNHRATKILERNEGSNIHKIQFVGNCIHQLFGR